MFTVTQVFPLLLLYTLLTTTAVHCQAPEINNCSRSGTDGVPSSGSVNVPVNPPVPVASQCVAQTCLNCTNAEAECHINNITQTLECSTTNISQCSNDICKGCSFCSGIYLLEPSGQWRVTSQCFSLQTNCENVFRQCTRSVSIEEDELLQPVLTESANCACYEENCTEHLTLNYTIIPSSSSLIPEATSTVVISVLPTGTPLLDEDEPSTMLSVSYIVIFAVIGVLLLIVILVAMAIGIICIRKRIKSIPRRQPRQSRYDSGLNEVSLPVTLLEVIGQGRFGYVWKSEYQDQVVAVKLFNYHNRHSWENERRLYSMESTAHENVLEYIGSESRGTGYESQFCMITRYHSLGSLSTFIRRQTVTWEQACTMIRGISAGLAHLHSESYTKSSGVVAEKYAVAHRDVKSPNVLVKSLTGECVISDLGFALILDLSTDVKQLANSGQVGTFRYMAPEALDARVNLHDLQSFKQIDVYALSLVMWEIVSRCTCTAQGDDVAPYQAPFEELVGERPSLEMMKDVVVARKLRPTVPAHWSSHQGLSVIVEAIQECWDADPEGRLPAANVLMRMEELMDAKIPNEADGAASAETASAQSRYTADTPANQIFDDIPIVDRPPPPPYYSDYHAGVGLGRRPYLQSSMPHLISEENPYSYLVPSRNIRYSAIMEGEVAFELQERRQSASVRNSLILGGLPAYQSQVSSSTTSLTASPGHQRRDSTLSNEMTSGDSGFQTSQNQQSITEGSTSSEHLNELGRSSEKGSVSTLEATVVSSVQRSTESSVTTNGSISTTV